MAGSNMTEDNENPLDFELVEKGKSRVDTKIEKTEAERNKRKVFSLGNIFLAIVGMVFLGAVLVIVAEITKTDPAILLILLILAILVIVAGIYSIFVFFAPRNLFFTSVEEGQAKAIMRGTAAGGEFRRIIMSFENYALDEDWNVVFTGKKKKHLLGGIRWLGIPGIDHIHEYKFKWVSMNEQGEKKASDETLEYIYVKKDIYVETLKGAEVGITMVPVDIEIYITARVINPYKSLFRVEKWLEYVLNRSKVPLRDYVGQQKSPEIFITSKENLGKFLYDKLEESGDLEYFRNEIGVEIEKLETPDIDMGKFQEIATAEWEAEQKGKAEVMKQTKEGEAYKNRRVQEKEADVDYLDGVYRKIQEFGDLGTTLRFLDTLTKAAEGSSNTIIPFGMIQDIARQVLGSGEHNELIKLPERAGITEEDIEDFVKAKTIKEADNKEE